MPHHVEVLLNNLKGEPNNLMEKLGFGNQDGTYKLHFADETHRDSLFVDEHGRLMLHDYLHDKNTPLIDEKGELHQLAGTSHLQHGTHSAGVRHGVAERQQNTAHTTREVTRVPSSSESRADWARRDHEAVAAANKAELARELSMMDKSSMNAVSPKLSPPPTPEAQSTPESAVPLEAPKPAVSEPTPLPTPDAQSTPEPAAPLETPKLTVAEPATPRPPITEPATPALSEKPPTPIPEQLSVQTSPEIFTNNLGISIDARIPQVYSVPASDGREIYELYGGSDAQAFSAAQQFLSQNPNASLRMNWPDNNLVGPMTYSVVEIHSDSLGKIITDNTLLDGTGPKLPTIKPETFSRKVPFTYKS